MFDVTASEVSEAPSNPRPVVLKNTIGEQFFGIFAPAAARLGWAVYAQERDDRRRPCRIDEAPFKWSKYQDVAPSVAEVDRWRHQVLAENVALILGRASGNVFAIDIDVMDADMAWRIEALADKLLGPSNWRRISNPPKRAILYRAATDDDLPPWQRHTFANADGSASDNVVEILGQGRSITAFGRHWNTGLDFTWSTGFSPISDPPSAVPAVTKDQLASFLAAVEEQVTPFVRKKLTAAEWSAGTERLDGTVYVPAVHLEYPIDAAGRVIDSRETYLLRLCWATVRRNAAAAIADDEMAEICQKIEGEFLATASSAGRWAASFLRSQIKSKCRSTRAKLLSGETRPDERTYRPRFAPRTVAQTAAQPGRVDVATMLRWLPSRRSTETGIALIEPSSPEEADERAIAEDPREAAEAASEKNRMATRRWIEEALAHDPESSLHAPHDLNLAPTGLGKTAVTLEELARAAATFGEPLRFGMAMPTHANAEEVHTKAERLQASLHDLATEAEALANAETSGLRAMIYRGRTRTTADGEHVCLYRHDDAILMQAAGASAAVLCSARRPVLNDDGIQIVEDGQPVLEEIDCPGKHGRNLDGTAAKRCIYWLQQEMVPLSDLVIFPHAYLGMDERLPEILKDNLRAVIVDEDITGKLVKTGKIPLERLLLRSRPEPRFTKAERMKGLQEGDLEADRRAAAEIVYHAMKAGRDPASDLIEDARRIETKKAIEKAARDRRVPAMDILVRNGLTDDEKTALAFAIADHARGTLDSAIAVTGRSRRLEADISYDTPSEEIEILVRDIRQPFIRDEHLMWTLLRERVTDLLLRETTPGVEGFVGQPFHKTDPRMRVVGRHVRMANRREMSLAYKPTLFLDASAELSILRKFVPSDLRVNVIEASVRQVTISVPNSTFSKTSLLTRSDEDAGRYVWKSKKIAELRQFLDVVCAHHSDGRVLVVCPKALRERFTKNGRWPANLDFMHYNATRGLDYAKGHVAAVTIGELNARPEDVDDIVAALTYDDDVPEPMLVGPDGAQPEHRTADVSVPLRNGGTAIYPVHFYASTMAAAVQRSIRENELVQSWGRLRPIHRETPGVVYHLGRTIPVGTVVDEIIAMPDLVRGLGNVCTFLRNSNGAARSDDIPGADAGGLGEEFAALFARVEADASLHPGLHVVRSADGRIALVSASAAPSAVRRLAEEGFDVSALPQTPPAVKSEADELRERAALDQRWAANDEYQSLKAWVFENLQFEGNLVILPFSDWGVDRTGRPVQPRPVRLFEAIEAMREPAIEVVDEEMAEAA